MERKSSLAQPLSNREPSRKSTDSSVTPGPRPLDRPRNISDKASEPSDSSSNSDSDAAAPLSRSRAYMRRSRYSISKPLLKRLSDADEDQDGSPPFLPFSDPKALTPAPLPDPSATLRINLHSLPPHSLPDPPPKSEVPLSQTVHSSSSSAQSQPQSRNSRPPQNPLSSLSPRQRRIAKEGSEGTPSMGSSFSDLDDASVTQSALEEALANEMNHGVASRMSTISQALRSRYL